MKPPYGCFLVERNACSVVAGYIYAKNKDEPYIYDDDAGLFKLAARTKIYTGEAIYDSKGTKLRCGIGEIKSITWECVVVFWINHESRCKYNSSSRGCIQAVIRNI